MDKDIHISFFNREIITRETNLYWKKRDALAKTTSVSEEVIKVDRITKRVLVVLKDHSEGDAMRRCLEPFGFSVDVAIEGLEALKLMWKHYPYQLLITDVIVDEISGLALHMLAKKKNPFVKTIALNCGGKVLRNVVEQFGIEQVMDLPVDTQGLCRAAKAILKGTDNKYISP